MYTELSSKVFAYFFLLWRINKKQTGSWKKGQTDTSLDYWFTILFRKKKKRNVPLYKYIYR